MENEGVLRLFMKDVISEICNNIIDHSDDDGYILVHSRPRSQYLKKKNEPPNIEIAIADCGIGIKQSLTKRVPEVYNAISHFKCIKKVLEGKVIYKDNKNHGGIVLARKFVEEFDGKIYIRSICAKAANRKYPRFFDLDWRFLPGTYVNILIPNYKKIRDKKIRDK